MFPLTINPESITAIRMGREWLPVRNFRWLEAIDLHATGKPSPGFEAFTGEHTGEYIYGIQAAVEAIRTSGRQWSVEELAAREAERRAEAVETFIRRHRTDPETFGKALQRQKGNCVCGAPLDVDGRVHYNDMDRKVLCMSCSPFQHVF